MLNETQREIIDRSVSRGWVLEPDSKRLLSSAGLLIPDGVHTADPDLAASFLADRGGPVVMKVVSPAVVHKSEFKGVVTGIVDETRLRAEFARLMALDEASGVLVEETAQGIELILGATNDFQFGPVILLGFGGTGVEIYRDTTMRMAPVNEASVRAMVRELKARPLLEGYRGGRSVDLEGLVESVVRFSAFALELEDVFDSIDVNPLICGGEGCVAADARIILNAGEAG